MKNTYPMLLFFISLIVGGIMYKFVSEESGAIVSALGIFVFAILSVIRIVNIQKKENGKED